MIDITSKFTPNSLKVRLSLIEYLLQLNNFHLAIKQNLFVVLDGAEYFICDSDFIVQFSDKYYNGHTRHLNRLHHCEVGDIKFIGGR